MIGTMKSKLFEDLAAATSTLVDAAENTMQALLERAPLFMLLSGIAILLILFIGSIIAIASR
jgi:hypothetical protein